MSLLDLEFFYFPFAFFGIIFTFGSLWVMYRLRRMRLLAEASEQWPSTEGTILGSEIEETYVEGGGGYRAVVRYEYEVDSQRFIGDRITFSGERHNEVTAKSKVKKYGLHAKVRVYYDPASPEISVLEPGTTFEEEYLSLFWACVGFFFAGVVLLGALFYNLSLLL